MKKTFFLLTGVLFVLLFLGCPNATETPKSNDARLQSLEVSEGSLSPPFAEDIFDYTVTVPNSVTSLTVTGEKADAFATMTPSDGKLSFTNLSVGTSDEQTIKVTAEDGTKTQEYKVKVVKQPSNVATLSALATNERSLTSAFNADTLEYTVIVPNSVTSLIVTGTADANATMTPSDGKLSFTNLSVGTSDEQIIKVTAEDGTTTKKYKVKVTRCEKIEMVHVPAGSFQRDGTAINISVITKPYYLGKYPITRQQFKDVMGVDPSDTAKSSGMTDPVQMVSWYHAIAFCNKLSLLEGLTPAYTVEGVSDWANLAFGDIPKSFHTDWDDAICDWGSSGYRLPTEMEWMWAAMGANKDARAGAMQEGINRTGYTKGYAGSIEEGSAQVNIGGYAWYKENSDGKTHPVREKLPNELELYDMSGNVMEWCWDWIDYYPNGREEDYRGPGSGTYNRAKGTGAGSYRVSRGGSWGIDAPGCTVAYRDSSDNTFFGRDYRGFRILRPVQSP